MVLDDCLVIVLYTEKRYRENKRKNAYVGGIEIDFSGLKEREGIGHSK